MTDAIKQLIVEARKWADFGGRYEHQLIRGLADALKSEASKVDAAHTAKTKAEQLELEALYLLDNEKARADAAEQQAAALGMICVCGHINYAHVEQEGCCRQAIGENRECSCKKFRLSGVYSDAARAYAERVKLMGNVVEAARSVLEAPSHTSDRIRAIFDLRDDLAALDAHDAKEKANGT